MQIAADSVVLIHYTLKDDHGKVLDSSAGGEPLAYLHGHGNLVPGLERALAGHDVGERLKVTVPAADGYGEYDQALVQKVPRRALKGIANLRVGMRLQAGYQWQRALGLQPDAKLQAEIEGKLKQIQQPPA